jgi:hypothetical protein
MTLAELRSSVRNLAREQSSDTGALFVSGDVLLDFFINAACDVVVLDLAKETPGRFLSNDDISLVANKRDYALTTGKEWLQILSVNKNVSSQRPTPIPYVPWTEELLAQYSGETAPEPSAWSTVGSTIYFLPMPSVAVTNYARVWFIAAEASTLATAGPTYIPRIAHRLIPLQAMIQICTMLETSVNNWAALYAMLLKKVSDVLGNPVQGQPRFIGPSFRGMVSEDTRDRAFFDKSGFFD